MNTAESKFKKRNDGFDISWPARLKNAAAPLYWVGLALLLASIFTAALAFVDGRQFQGVSVWLKPLKFQIATGVYLLTLALFMVWLPPQDLETKKARCVVWSAVISGLFEVIYITWQGGIRLASHFNLSTKFFASMYALMGVGAGILTSASLVLGVLIAGSRGYGLSFASKWAVVMGLVLTFFMGTAFGAYLSAQRGGHWVGGVLSDSGGLTLFKWSRGGGDLRVAHFFCIHAMHFIPGFALILGLLGVPHKGLTVAIWGFSIAFTAFCFWTFMQARSGLPFLT